MVLRKHTHTHRVKHSICCCCCFCGRHHNPSLSSSFSQSCIIHSSNPYKVQQTYWIPNLLPNDTEIHSVHAISKHMSQ